MFKVGDLVRAINEPVVSDDVKNKLGLVVYVRAESIFVKLFDLGEPRHFNFSTSLVLIGEK